MGFDSFIQDFDSERDKVKTTPTLVDETFNTAQKLLDTDYLGNISKIKILKKYIEGYKEMNLYKRGWRIQFGSSKQWAGLCSSNEKRLGDSKRGKNIYISIEFTKHDGKWKENMTDTIYHEIGHAINKEIFEFDKKNEGELHKIDDLNYASEGHGIVWKAICKSLCGHDCRIRYENYEFKDSFKKFKYDCSFCGHKGYGDYQGFTDSCSECGKDIITEPTIN